MKKLKPPPKDTRCDKHIGWHTDYSNTPVVDRCPNMATVTLSGESQGMPWVDEVWVCEEHSK